MRSKVDTSRSLCLATAQKGSEMTKKIFSGTITPRPADKNFSGAGDKDAPKPGQIKAGVNWMSKRPARIPAARRHAEEFARTAMGMPARFDA